MGTKCAAEGFDQVASVMRALAILEAFGTHDSLLGLAEISRRAVLPKSSALRIARTLARAQYLVTEDSGGWRLGPAAARLGASYQRSFDLGNEIEPALQRLSETTGHSASFFVREQEQRVRLVRVRGDSGFVSPSPVGHSLPLDRGAAGLVILASEGKAGATFDLIRRRGFHATIGEADASAASVAAAVSGASARLVGALCLTFRSKDCSAEGLQQYGPCVVEAARQLSLRLSTSHWTRDTPSGSSAWHP